MSESDEKKDGGLAFCCRESELQDLIKKKSTNVYKCYKIPEIFGTI